LNHCEEIIKSVSLKRELSKEARKKALEYVPFEVVKKYEEMLSWIDRPLKWSVIMPSWNCSAYIEEAIQSILSQTESSWELIVIDDGSSDNTKEILKKYPQVKVIRNLEGPSCQANCWNLGFKEAKGEFLAFLDADDVLLPQALKEMEKAYSKDVVCAWSQNEHWNQNLTQKLGLGFSSEPYEDGRPIDSMLKNKCVVSHLLTCRREALVKLGGVDTSYLTSADRWLVLSMDKIGKLAFKDQVLHRYRYLRPGCTTLEKRALQVQTLSRLLREFSGKDVKLEMLGDSFNYRIARLQEP
jgi:glycosyltransferase involved in cell wall biosynthesis